MEHLSMSRDNVVYQTQDLMSICLLTCWVLTPGPPQGRIFHILLRMEQITYYCNGTKLCVLNYDRNVLTGVAWSRDHLDIIIHCKSSF